MALIKIFQVGLVIRTVAYVGWFFMPSAPPLFGETVERMTAYHGFNAVLPAHVAVYGSEFALWIIAAVGMFFFTSWGRVLFALMVLITILLAPLTGVAVQDPLEVTLGALSLILDGFLVALAFFSPLSKHFSSQSRV